MEVLRPYITLTPAHKFAIGKRAAEYGTTAAIRFFMKKYPELPLKDTTVQRLTNSYQSQLHDQLHRGDTSSLEATNKENGHPLMIGDELDKQVRDYITYV